MSNILTRARNILTPGDKPLPAAAELPEQPLIAESPEPHVAEELDAAEIQQPILTPNGWLVPEPKA